MPATHYPSLSAEEAVSVVKNGDTISFSGFTPAGAAKAFPTALAKRARELHADGKCFNLRILTGASSGYSIDEDLAKSEAIAWRGPYQTGGSLRKQINLQKVEYVDMHLSHLPQAIDEGFLGKIDLGVIEATEITPDGRVYLTTSIGASPTYLKCAKKIIIEINRHQSPRLREMADVFVMPPPPHRYPIPIYEPLTRIGWPYAQVDPKKIIGIVENDEPDNVSSFTPPDDTSIKIAGHVIRFLLNELKARRIPESFLPLQSGVGNIANGIMSALGSHPDIPPFMVYSEVFQNSLVDIMMAGKLLGASATSLTVTSDKLSEIVDNIDFFGPRIILRPQEISNNPGIIRRLGVISMNTALEFDIYGNVNSSHLFGTDIVNGIGGSGDFTRNSYLSIFTAPSILKCFELHRNYREYGEMLPG